jgi:hypothetical protein
LHVDSALPVHVTFDLRALTSRELRLYRLRPSRGARDTDG